MAKKGCTPTHSGKQPPPKTLSTRPWADVQRGDSTCPAAGGASQRGTQEEEAEVGDERHLLPAVLSVGRDRKKLV